MQDIENSEECDMPIVALIRDQEEPEAVEGDEEKFSLIGWFDPKDEVRYYQLICLCCGSEHWRKETKQDESHKNN